MRPPPYEPVDRHAASSVPLLAAALLLLAACSGEPSTAAPLDGAGAGGAGQPEPGSGDAGPGGDAGSQGSSGGSDGGPADAGVSGQGGGGSSSEIHTVDVPDAPCVESGAPQRTLLAADELGITFDRAGRAGERYFAFDSASLAFVTFADVAPTPDTPLAAAPIYADLVALSGEGAGRRALEIDDAGALVVSRFGPDGARIGSPVELDGASTSHHALLAAGDRALALWNVGGELRGHALGAEGTVGERLDFGAGSCGEYGCTSVILAADEHFAVVWGRVLHDGTFGLSFAAIDASGGILSVKPVLASFGEYQLADAAILPDESLAVLLAEGFPSRGVLLQRLDVFGNVSGPSQRLLGAVEPWAIASQGSTLGVVARSAADRAMLRTFSGAGQASGAWTCLDDNATGEAFSPRAAIFADVDGYGLVVRRMDGASTFSVLPAP